MSPMLPDFFSLIYSKEQIAKRVAELGAEISSWARQLADTSDQQIISIPVLRGGIFFFADLVREISESLEMTPVRTWGYVAGAVGQMEEDLKVHLFDLKPAGRSILLIDDLCDSGRTLKTLTEMLKLLGAADVRSAVLIKRVIDEATFNPDYVGFEYNGSEWFVGYGMELEERWRNLSDVYLIKP